MSTHNLHSELDNSAVTPIHRIGSVSRLAGVPVSTLRMWEARHGAFEPGKTEGRHRLYSEEDVVRARLLRQLTEQGHSIGGIARMGLYQLQQMLVHARGAAARAPAPERLRVHVVSAALAARVTSAEWARRLQGTVVDLRAVSVSLDEALVRPTASGAADEAIDLLLVRVNAMNSGESIKLTQLKDATGARHAIVLYNFCAQATLDWLRAAGFTVRRQPVDDVELADLVRSVTWARANNKGEDEHRGAAIPSRRFSDEVLAAVAASPPKLLCECPRHLADIIGQLASFEEYSASCLNDSEEDAHVHARLRSIAGSARAMFEQGLDLVLAHAAARQPADTTKG